MYKEIIESYKEKNNTIKMNLLIAGIRVGVFWIGLTIAYFFKLNYVLIGASIIAYFSFYLTTIIYGKFKSKKWMSYRNTIEYFNNSDSDMLLKTLENENMNNLSDAENMIKYINIKKESTTKVEWGNWIYLFLSVLIMYIIDMNSDSFNANGEYNNVMFLVYGIALIKISFSTIKYFYLVLSKKYQLYQNIKSSLNIIYFNIYEKQRKSNIKK